MDARAGRLGRQIAFLVEADRLKQVLRQSLIVGGERRENTAEHSWHLTLMAVVLAEHALADDGVAGEGGGTRPLDLLKVVKMLIVHDLVEIDAGDTFAYDEAAKADQHEREARAAQRIFGLLPAPADREVRALWDEFEERATAEARFALALDRLQPILLNYYNDGAGWKKHGVKVAQVLAVNAPMGEGAPALWSYAQELIADAVQKGMLGT